MSFSRGSRCVIHGCNNYSAQKDARSFFRFPKDESQCQEWVIRTRRPEFDVILKNGGPKMLHEKRLCDAHFTEQDFKNPRMKSQGLNRGVVPSVNLFISESVEFPARTIPVKRELEVDERLGGAVDASKSVAFDELAMGRTCFVPHCNAVNVCSVSWSLFRAPSDPKLLAQWNKNIARADRQLSQKDHVCERHFTPAEIIRTNVLDASRNWEVPLQVPKLVKDAVPTIFPGRAAAGREILKTMKNCQSKEVQCSMSSQEEVTDEGMENKAEDVLTDAIKAPWRFPEPKKNSPVGAPRDAAQGARKKLRVRRERERQGAVSSSETDPREDTARMKRETDVANESRKKPANAGTPCANVSRSRLSISEIYRIILPGSSWAVHRLGEDCLVVCELTLKGQVPRIERRLDVNVETSVCRMFLGEREIGGPRSVASVAELEERIEELSGAAVCSGGPPRESFDVEMLQCGYVEENGRWRHNACQFLARVNDPVCRACSRLGNTLSKRKRKEPTEARVAEAQPFQKHRFISLRKMSLKKWKMVKKQVALNLCNATPHKDISAAVSYLFK